MKSKIDNISKMGMLLALTAIAALCIALPVRAGLPYPTASTVSQLIADIHYGNTAGGRLTINLQPNTTFDLLTYDNSNEHGVNGLPIIAGNLTIIGNGDTIERVVGPSSYNFRLFEVGHGASLTLIQMTLQSGYIYAYNGGAIYNQGTLTISDCTLSNNTAYYSGYISSLLGGEGGAIFNGSGTVVISNSILSGNSCIGNSAVSAFTAGGAIYNDSGTLTLSNSTLSGNLTGGSVGSGDGSMAGEGGAIYNGTGRVTVNNSIVSSNYAAGDLALGGGIHNAGGTTTVENTSRITGNAANGPDDVHNSSVLYQDDTSTIGVVIGNPAIIVQVSEPSPRISLTTSNTIVISWPYPSTSWSLQQNSELTTTNWVMTTNTVANDGTNNFISAAPSLNKLFFRLKR
jgi:hypothetical protein